MLERVCDTERSQFLVTIDLALGELRGLFDEARTAVTGAGTAALASLDGSFSSARTEGQACLAEGQVSLEEVTATRSAELSSWGEGASSAVDQAVIARRDQAVALGDSHAASARAAGESAAQDLHAGIEAEAAAAEAHGGRGGGGDETAEAKAQASEELSRETAEAVRDSQGDAGERLQESGQEAADGFIEQAQEAACTFGESAPALAEQLGSFATDAAAAMETALSAAQEGFAQQGEQLEGALSAGQAHASEVLSGQVGEVTAAFSDGGQTALCALQQGAEETVSAADEAIASVAPELEGADPALVEGEVGEPLAQIYRDASGVVQEAICGVGAEVEGKRDEAVCGVAGAGEQLSAEAAALPDQLSSAVDADLQRFDVGLGVQAAEIQAQGDLAVDELGTELDGELTSLDTSFQESGSELDTQLDGQVQSGVEAAHEPVVTLDTRIGQAHTRIDERAQMGFWERQWEDIKGLFSWETLLTLLAGLVIGILAVLAILALPEALAGLALVAAICAIGAVAGALVGLAGTLIHNAFAGKSGWALFEGWWQNMLIGAAFGAVLLLIPELVAGALAAMALSATAAGLLTVIVNLVTGQAWDKNLIANMALAAIFVGVGKVFNNLRGARAAREETPPSTRPGGLDLPEQRPTTPRPEPESTVVPRAPTTLEQLRAQLSDRAQSGFDQQRNLLSSERWSQLESGLKNADGTYDVARANRLFESKAVSEKVFQERVAQRNAQAQEKANGAMEKIKNACEETDGTNRPNATLGRGTTEEALVEEIRTGRPYKSAEGHYQKVANYIATLREQITVLQKNRLYIQDPAEIARIDAAIQRAQQRIDAMQPALYQWNARAGSHPEVWNPDGTSRVQPGWPSDPSPQ